MICDFCAFIKEGIMGNKTISMTQLRRIIQLKIEGHSKRTIAVMLNIHRTTVDSYLCKLGQTESNLDKLLQYSEDALCALVFNPSAGSAPDNRLTAFEKQLDYFHCELSRPGVTRKTLWDEYKQACQEGYGYTQFCEHLARYLSQNKATMHLYHRAGEFLQIDFAGKKLHYVNVKTGEIIYCYVLVCTLPYSKITYVEALTSAKQEFMFCALTRCLEFFGGVPRNILSDNMKQYIVKNQRYEYTFTELANQWALHYNTNLDATRPRKPKDKPTVENTVYQSYLRIYAKLRNEEFYTLTDLNKRIKELLLLHNHAPFQKLSGSRHERFISNEKPFLKPLPMEPFTIKHTTTAKVQMNYHVVLGEDKHQYSVPYKHIGQATKIIYDEANVEIYIGFERIALHKRDYRTHAYTTHPEHMPERHRKYNETLGWDAEYFLSIASKIGENSIAVFKKIQASKDFVEQTYNACIGLKRLSEIYGSTRFEAACKRALEGSRANYGIIKNILKNNLDKQAQTQLSFFTLPDHENIRGSEHYN